MKPELPQPFEQEDIRKDPKAVVIALLIGLLLICVGAIAFLYFRLEKKDERIYSIYKEMVDYRTQKAEYYEKMIFYKHQTDQFKKSDTLLREKTEPLVQKILE